VGQYSSAQVGQNSWTQPYHPAVVSECYRLACMILAYGLVQERPVLPHSAQAYAATAAASGELGTTDHRVIVVDDVADVLVSVCAFLGSAGFAVTKASSGDEALRMIVSDPHVDILVTDFAMPGLNGADLIEQATQIRPSLKALVITGYPNADGLGDLPTGTIVLSKPFRRCALVAAVNSLLGNDSADRDQTARLPETVSH
jgi:CheY-like chemotaxis protein